MPLCVNDANGKPVVETKVEADIESINFFTTSESETEHIWRITTKSRVRCSSGSRLDLFFLDNTAHVKALEVYFRLSEAPEDPNFPADPPTRRKKLLHALADFILKNSRHFLRIKGELRDLAFLPASLVKLGDEIFH